MKKIVPIIIFLFGGIVNAQIWQNMIPNYSFENHNLSNWNADSGCGNNPPIWDYTYIIDYWAVIDEWTHPLRYDPCLSFVPVATADLYHISCRPSNDSRSGETWGYTKTREVLVVPTGNYANGGLQSNKHYFIEVFNKSSASEGLYVVGYEKQPEICGYPNNKWMHQTNRNKKHAQVYLNFDATATIPYSDSSGWTRYKGYFSPITNKRWLSFGSSGTWDDLRIYEVQPNGCRDNWYFDNTVFNYPLEFFQAGNNIYVGKGLDPEDGVNHIAGEVKILKGSNVVLQAGNQVIIEEGFSIEAGGSKLRIENKPCNDGFCPEKLSFSDKLLCDEPVMHIGDPNEPLWGVNVTWSPASYLNDPTSPNPLFTPPSGSGSIDYNVSVTYTCDGGFQFTQSHNVTVQYTNSSDPTATISASNINSGTYNFSADFALSDGVTEVTITHVGGIPSYQETFYNGIDFSNGFFSWDMEGAYLSSSCHDSQFLIEAINKCTGASESITLQWNKNYPGNIHLNDLPNIIFPPDVGFCFQTVDYADHYEFFAFNSHGNVFFSNQGPITSNDMCIWHGQGAEHLWGTGQTIMYSLKLVNLCGIIREEHGFVYTMDGGRSMIQDDEELLPDEENSILQTKINLFPNPNNGSFIVHLPQKNNESKLEIYDFIGRLVHSQTISESIVNINLKLNSGAYTLRWSNEDLNEVLRFVVE